MAAAVAEIDALGVPSWHSLATADARRVEDELFSTDAHLPVARVTDLGFAGPGGRVPVRVYRPDETPAPTLVFCHGGGWQLGTLDSADGICRRLCRRLDAVIVSVDYRLAPEHPFPAAVADAVAAVEWVESVASDLGGDGRIGVAGTSAGGNLAAAVALAAAADRAFGFDLDVDLAVQALFYPMLTPDFEGASRRMHADGPLLTTRDVHEFWRTYLDGPAHAANPYAVPLGADEATLSGVAPAVVAVGGHDPLRSEAVAYAHRLRNAGAVVDSIVAEELPHGFLSFADDASEGQTGVAAADRAFDAVARDVASRLTDAG
ncbi:MAG: esterase/lipase [halophilic archaeon J07HB67]|nr:MAG: esterase/lipase [halophilic archaeon J07HB67]